MYVAHTFDLENFPSSGPNNCDLTGLHVEAKDVWTQNLSGAKVNESPGDGSNIVAYGLREYSADWFELYLTVDTTGYNQFRTMFMPQAQLATFDATSGNTVLEDVDDFDGTDTLFTPGDNTAYHSTQLAEGSSHNDEVDNGYRSYWGLRVQPGAYKGDVYNPVKESVLDKNITDINLQTQITSIFEHRDGIGNEAIYATGTNSLFPDQSGGVTDYHGIYRYVSGKEIWEPVSLAGLTDPVAGYNTIQYPHAPSWANYDGVAYCATPAHVVIEFGDALSTTAPIDTPSSPELINMIEWNNRLWGVEWDSTYNEVSSNLKCSKVGDGSDWTDTGQRAGSATWNVGGGSSGDPVTGLSVFQKQMVVFKADRIYLMQTGTPNVDLMQHNLQEWTRGTGCVAHNTIRTVRGDLLFLSRNGVVSLQSAATEGNLEESLLSLPIVAFEGITLSAADRAYAVVNQTESQYIIAFPTEGLAKNNVAYVLDFTNPEAQAWTRWDGHTVGSCYFELKNEFSVLIGGRSDLDGYKELYAGVFVLDDVNRYHDDGYTFTSRIVTKSFTQGDEILKKRYHRWFASVRLTGTELGLNGWYKFDREEPRTNAWQFELESAISSGGRWDSAIWDTDRFGSRTSVNKTLRYRMHGSGGRFAQSVQFMFESQSKDQGFTFSALGFFYSAATSRYADGNN
jgi:hypothetical protein